ncbi:ABC transporter permease [Streptomyces sp. NPDC060194]|uniref:ABC transporter permease n=1 Tax=Streptomyces sp. NPDC060194 TaxID=3347069 RepID=UPI00364E2420
MSGPTPTAAAGTKVPELDPEASSAPAEKAKSELVGRSPGQLIWMRLKRDRTAKICAAIVFAYFAVAALAPVISKLYGKDPYTLYGQDQGLLDMFNFPIEPYGGISSEHWFGIEPNLGRDVFMQLIYGMRTSLYMSLVVTVFIVIIGVLLGLTMGFFGGKVDYWLSRLSDFLLAFPSQLFFIAFMPVAVALFVAPEDETPTYIRAIAITLVLTFLGWMGLARLIRATAMSLREREFIEAAKISGASNWRIIRKELLPNIISPVIVQGTLMLPANLLSVAFLSFVGVGFVEPTPDWGRMFSIAGDIYKEDPTYMFFPGIAMVVFVVTFNLLGDSIRDAFDPKAGR